MFDPELWRRSKVTVIVLVSLGALLVIPAAVVFFLASLLLTDGNFSFVFDNDENTWLFFSAVGASSTGTLAWAALVFLLAFQRHSVRAHLFTWPLVIVAGVTCFLGSLAWMIITGGGGGANGITLVLLAVMLLSPCLVGLGIIHFRRARRSSRQMS